MQTKNNPSKRNPRAFEKAQSVVTKGLQTNNTIFIKKANTQTRITQREGQANPILKNPYFQACMRLCIRATHVLYATVQERPLCMGTSVRDYAEEKPAYKYKFFLKKQEKCTRLSNTVLSMNQDKIPHTNFKEKTI